MSLTSGTTLGPYEILSPIGAGGMGEVYKARDTRLDRTVAIKVLPEHVAADPNLKQRFEREAKTISSLNHPHICTLHDIGEQDGVDFLVMEYLEGDTLAQRLEKGALPLDQALKVAIEIADALDKAHRQGIVHRDLKPGNIMLSEAGAKLLDFGLAKPSAAAISVSTAMPTVSEGITAQGSILGTLQYMAPEQLEGEDVDARTDIFAFGTTVYEAITGTKAFTGKSQASLIGSILKDEPRALTERQPVSPPALNRVVTKCLEKDPERRWHSAHDLHDELAWIVEGDLQREALPAGVAARQRAGWRRGLSLALGTLILGGLITGLGVWSVMWPELPPVVRFALSPDEAGPFHSSIASPDLAISPDGEHIAYLTGNVGLGGRQLHVRRLDQLTSETLVAEGEMSSPFFAPNGLSVGFGDRQVLKRVSVQGGPTSTICDLQGALLGASWGADGTIVFASNNSSGLWRVPAVGGEPERLTTPDVEQGERRHTWPEILPGGQAVLFTIRPGSIEEPQVAVLSLDTGEQKVVLRGGSFPRYSPTGHLLYGAQGTLWAVGFDLTRLDTTGDPVPVQERVVQKVLGGAMNFSVSEDGSLIYMPQRRRGPRAATLVWVDREGQEEPLSTEPRDYTGLRISPDGQRVAVVPVGEWDVLIYDLVRDVLTRLTFDEAIDNFPVWTPDGERIVFTSTRAGGQFNLWWKAADGTGEVERLTTSPTMQLPASVSGDGQTLVFSSAGAVTLLSLEGEREEERLIEAVTYFDVSPDGRWIAYQSTESGQDEIYAKPFPNVNDGRWQISRGGGRTPLWGPDGRELFYRGLADDAMMVVPIETEPTFNPGTPALLFEAGHLATIRGTNRAFDIAPDGQRFLMVSRGETGDLASSDGPQINVVLNWSQELKARVPIN